MPLFYILILLLLTALSIFIIISFHDRFITFKPFYFSLITCFILLISFKVPFTTLFDNLALNNVYFIITLICIFMSVYIRKSFEGLTPASLDYVRPLLVYLSLTILGYLLTIVFGTNIYESIKLILTVIIDNSPNWFEILSVKRLLQFKVSEFWATLHDITNVDILITFHLNDGKELKQRTSLFMEEDSDKGKKEKRKRRLNNSPAEGRSKSSFGDRVYPAYPSELWKVPKGSLSAGSGKPVYTPDGARLMNPELRSAAEKAMKAAANLDGSGSKSLPKININTTSTQNLAINEPLVSSSQEQLTKKPHDKNKKIFYEGDVLDAGDPNYAEKRKVVNAKIISGGLGSSRGESSSQGIQTLSVNTNTIENMNINRINVRNLSEGLLDSPSMNNGWEKNSSSYLGNGVGRPDSMVSRFGDISPKTKGIREHSEKVMRESGRPVENNTPLVLDTTRPSIRDTNDGVSRSYVLPESPDTNNNNNNNNNDNNNVK